MEEASLDKVKRVIPPDLVSLQIRIRRKKQSLKDLINLLNKNPGLCSTDASVKTF